MKKLLSLLLAITMIVGLAACSAKPGDSEPAEPVASAEQPAESAPAEGAAPAESAAPAEVQYKEHLNIGLESQLTTLDPTQKNNQVQNILYHMTHDSLINYNFETSEYEPELALSWEWIDPLTLELKLREGVVFHDGTTFDAYDVEATLARCTTGTVSNYYDHCEITDPYTVRTVIKAPNVDWVDTLAHTASSICSAEAIAANPDEAYVGTGPWAVTSFVSGDSVELARNDNYWGELPNTKTVTMRYYGEASARLVALQNGELDMMTTVSETELAFAEEDQNIVVDRFMSTNIYYFCLNCSKAPGDDLNLRRAIMCGINKEELIAGFGDDMAKPAETFWGWNSYGYFDQFDTDLSYNPDKAKEYLAQANGNSFSIITFGSYLLIAQIIQEQLRQIGIEMTIIESDSAGTSSSTKWGSDHDSVIYSIACNPSGSDMFRLTAYGTAGNRACLYDETDPFYTLQSDSLSAADDAARKQILADFQTVNHDQVYFIPLFYASGNVAYVKGMERPGILANKNHDFAYACLPLA